MKQTLTLKLGQQLTMTPQLQQAIKLLQLSALDLDLEIQQNIESNPMLEVEEDSDDSSDEQTADDERSNNEDVAASEASESESDADVGLEADRDQIDASDDLIEAPDDYTSGASEASGDLEYEADVSSPDDPQADSEWNEDIPEDLPVDSQWDDVYSAPAASGSSNPDEDDYTDVGARNAADESLSERLAWQLNLTPITERDRLIAETIIDAIDETGYLQQSLEEILACLPEQEDYEVDEVQAVLKLIQQFEPAGVGARDLQECLSIQLGQIDSDEAWVILARELVDDFLDLLAARDYKTLQRRMRIDEDTLKDVVEGIQTLSPRPGAMLDQTRIEYVVPDVFVRKSEGRWLVELNPDVAPRLRINNSYASLVKRADDSSDNQYLRDNLQEARWFIKSLQSRNETLLKVATEIVLQQRGFLDYGEEAMKPLVLHDIADAVEMHESTISRVTTRKYMHTPRGIYELKYFFSSHVGTGSGGEVSSTAIRALIRKLTTDENPRKPLSDSKIAQLLAAQDINVARRTVAKYRESLSIPPSNERKRLV